MEFRLLGPIEAADHDGVITLGGPRQRALLALLLLHANEVVSTDRLVDRLWAEHPPPAAGKTVAVYVSRLRKALGGDRLVGRPPGYLLRVDRSELDLAHFERLVDEAGRADPAQAGMKLRQALALWRGPPLADLAYEPFARAEIRRLDELRWAAVERRIDADLATGRHTELIGELEALIAEHPLRERLRAQLMLALYRSGRQAEALEQYRAARRDLTEQLGLEPSGELQRLEAAILRHDPALDPLSPPPAHPPAAPGRSLLIAPGGLDVVDALVSLAKPLAAMEPSRELVIAAIVEGTDIGTATAALAERRAGLLEAGVAARTAAFSSPSPARDLVRLACRENVELLVMEAPRKDLGDETGVVLQEAPCDVALFVTAGGTLRPGSIVVPFGAAWHDWAALELGAWVARATGAQLRLIGAASGRRLDGRDASRLLADASLVVQQTAGVVAEPMLASPGRKGVIELAADAGLLVVGLSERWRQEGLGRVRSELVASPPAPTVLVRRGLRPGGLAPPETATAFGWSLTAGASEPP
jgi:DNA-binding SARP family transcriptional activator